MEVEEFIRSYHPVLSQYCPVVIDKDGYVYECKTGHLNELIALYGDADILSELPEGISPLFWLITKMSAIVVDYENQVYSKELTTAQKATIERLAQSELICEHLMNIHGNY